MTFKYYLTLFIFLLAGQVLAQDLAECKENNNPNMPSRVCEEAPHVKPRSSLSLRCELKDHHLAKLQLPFKHVTLRVVGTYNTQLSDKWHIPLISGKLINPSRLRHLTVLGSGLRDQHIAGITDFIHLRTLILENNVITDVGTKLIAQLSKLKKLDLQHNEVGDEGVEHLARLPQLEYLDLTCNRRITDSGIRSFLTHPKLQTLMIEHTLVSHEMRDELRKRIKEVKYL